MKLYIGKKKTLEEDGTPWNRKYTFRPRVTADGYFVCCDQLWGNSG